MNSSGLALLAALATLAPVRDVATRVAPAAALKLKEGGTSAVDPDRETLARGFRIADKGLAWLAKQQNVDRSFSMAKDETDITQAPLAVTALSALAFMAGGSTLGRGPYQAQVKGAIEFIMAKASDRPYGGETPIYFTMSSDSTSKMHGHGYATLALAQAYGTFRIDPSYGEAWEHQARSELERLRKLLAGGVRLIELSQSDKGGWYYEPFDNEHEGSVTITMIQALRAARDVGIKVDKGVIERAERYIRDSQSREGAEAGGFKYKLNDSHISFALTAAAVATLNATGTYDSGVIDRGIEYMLRNDPVTSPPRRSGSDNFPYYARLYAAQAYYTYRDPSIWQRWQKLMVEECERQQSGSGGGSIGNGEYGRVYSTASCCLILLLPLQYLPIFQR